MKSTRKRLEEIHNEWFNGKEVTESDIEKFKSCEKDTFKYLWYDYYSDGGVVVFE